MIKLEEKLREIRNLYPIEKVFTQPIPEGCPITFPSELEDNYQKNIYLKDNYSKALKNEGDFTNYYWIVREWGGIRGFKIGDKNNRKFKLFKTQLHEKRLSKECFEVISSLSKVASLLEPESYVIYDSRVIFSLNWLLFKYTNEKYFFPQPKGRNINLLKYDMQTILRLSDRGYEYIDGSTAFFKYCELIKTLSKKIYPGRKIYNLEILLFLIAPELIISDIRKSIKLNI